MVRRLPLPARAAITDPLFTSDLLSQRSRDRAIRSMRCLPFSDSLYRDLQQQGLDAAKLWQNKDRYRRSQRWPRNPEALEDDLRWLITVGVLRREVDGQGLTSRFRLTPLGRALLDQDPELLIKPARAGEQLRQALRRHWPL